MWWSNKVLKAKTKNKENKKDEKRYIAFLKKDNDICRLLIKERDKRLDDLQNDFLKLKEHHEELKKTTEALLKVVEMLTK